MGPREYTSLLCASFSSTAKWEWSSQLCPRVTEPSHKSMSVKHIAWGQAQESSGQMITIVFVCLKNGDSRACLTELSRIIMSGGAMQNEEMVDVPKKISQLSF